MLRTAKRMSAGLAEAKIGRGIERDNGQGKPPGSDREGARTGKFKIFRRKSWAWTGTLKMFRIS